MENRLLTITEAAQVLDLSKDTIRRRIKKGELPARKMAGPYGEMYYIQEHDLAQAAEIIQVVPVSRDIDAREFREMMQALHGEIAALREEVEQLRGQLQLQAPAEGKKPWWRRIFGKE